MEVLQLIHSLLNEKKQNTKISVYNIFKVMNLIR